MGKRTTSILACLGALYGCNAPLPPPDYDAPSDSEALGAFKSAMKADWLDKPYDVSEQPEAAGPMNYRKEVEWNHKNLANKHAPEVYKTLRHVDVGDCVWQNFSQYDVPKWSRERVPEAPEAVYKCGFTLRYRIYAPQTKPDLIRSEGFFYRVGGRFAYLGKYDNPY